MRQIFCKLPNPFPYLNYITKFFFGRKSYRQRVFQGPLTLGLQSPSLRASSFRLACGNPSIPTRSQLTAQTAHLLLLHPSVRVGYNRRFHSAGALAGFPARVPTRSHITAQTAHLLFCIFLSASVTTDLSIPRVLSQVFPARVPARSFITAQTAHLLFCILLSVSVTTDVSILRVLSQVFLLGYPRAIISPR